jgi:hypothetical protein
MYEYQQYQTIISRSATKYIFIVCLLSTANIHIFVIDTVKLNEL